MKTRLLLLLMSLALLAPATVAAENTYLYKVKLVQAAPGKILDLIDLYKTSFTAYKDAGDETPLWIRHSQGDHWDLLLLFPLKSYADYYHPERIAKRTRVLRDSQTKIEDAIAWQEDLFVYGPPLDDLRQAFTSSSFFHVEMFHSLSGRQAKLFQEREMENAYQRRLKRPENFIFVRDQGAAWDLFTIGAYRNLKHFAESGDIPEADQEAAARAAGFETASHIGPYLRTLISSHHDTLAVAVK
jgi:hypothetical protein